MPNLPGFNDLMLVSAVLPWELCDTEITGMAAILPIVGGVNQGTLLQPVLYIPQSFAWDIYYLSSTLHEIDADTA